MLFQRVNRTDAEKVFVVAYNASGGAFLAGQPVQWDVGTSADGIRVTTPGANQLSAFAGIAQSAIANGAYGLVQVYGYCSTALLAPDVTTALVAGSILLPVAATANFKGDATDGWDAGDGKSGFVVAMQTNTTMTTPVASAHKVFIRAL